MKTRLLHLVFLLLATLSLSAQSLEGQVLDEAGQGLPFASLSLLAWPDSSLVKGTLADAEGRFSLPNTQAGRFRLQARSAGYTPWLSGELAGGQSQKLGSIRLEPLARTTAEVEVRSNRALLRVEPGKTIVDVQNSPLAASLMAIDVLRRMPGVSVDNNGAISLRGRSGVQVMIDGKVNYLSPEQLAALLTATPGSQIAEIEIITQPGAQYEGQGTAGIIHIRFKKNTTEGFNGTANALAGYGVYHKANAGLSLGYKSGRWNLFGSYAYVNNGGLMDLPESRQYSLNAQSERQNLYTYYRTEPSSHTFRSNVDFQWSPKTQIGIQTSLARKYDLYVSSGEGTLYQNGALAGYTYSRDYNPDDFINYTAAAYLNHRFDTLGQELRLDVDYGSFNQSSTQDFWTEQQNAQGQWLGTSEQFMRTTPNFSVWVNQLAYTKPLSRVWKLETGGKFTRAWVSNGSDFFLVDPATRQRSFDAAQSNLYTYDEQIRAAFAQLNGSQEPWAWTFGLRWEQWVAEGLQSPQNQRFTRDQPFWLPSASLRWNGWKVGSTSLAYSRRIQRPSYGWMNPYSFRVNNFTWFVGNPQLKPEVVDNLELSQSFFEGQLNLSLVAAEGRNTLQNYVSNRLSDTATRIYVMPLNLQKQQTLTLNVFGSYSPVGWLSLDYFASYGYNDFRAQMAGSEIRNRLWAGMAQLTSIVSLPGNWKIEVTGNYFTPSVGGFSRQEEWGSLGIGLSKRLLEEKLVLALNAQDIFWTQRYWNSISTRFMTQRGGYRGDSRQVTLSVNYRFGRLKGSTASRRQKDEDLQRLGGR